jgi:hypothetical protein
MTQRMSSACLVPAYTAAVTRMTTSSLRKSTRVAFLLLPSNGFGFRRSLPGLPPLFDVARPMRGRCLRHRLRNLLVR